MIHLSHICRNGLFIFVSLVFVASCGSVNVADLNESDFDGAVTDTCDGVTTSFTTDVVPIFTASCTNGTCHTDAAQAGSLNLDVNQAAGTTGIFTEISDGRIDAADTANSLILTRPLGLNSHGGGEIFSSVTDANYITIFCWIEAGAVDDSA